MRRLAKGAIAAALTSCAPAPVEVDAGGGARPNVILIVIDTLRRDHLGLYGCERPTSPRLDAFAEGAAVFERCLAASSWTEPSTASLLTGLYPARHGCHEYALLPPQALLLAEVLKEAGYRTFGLSANPNASPRFGFDQGFDDFWFRGDGRASEYPDVSEMIGPAEEFLARDEPRPFFLYLHVMNVHGPYSAPAEYRKRFRREPSADFAFRNETWLDLMIDGRLERREEVTPAHVNDLKSRYEAAVAWTDWVIGGFLERRARSPGSERDLVVVTADHGEELFDHGGFGHGFTLHREVVDVPLLIRAPAAATGDGSAAAPGRRIPDPVSLVDVPATLLDLAGLLPDDSDGRFGDGRSLRPLIDGAGAFERDAPLVAQLERKKQGRAFLLEQWPRRLVEVGFDYAGTKDRTSLFDLEADPEEREDLATRDPDVTAGMLRGLRARRSALEAAALQAESVPLDPELREQMDRLGYGAAGTGGEAADDRD